MADISQIIAFDTGWLWDEPLNHRLRNLASKI